MEDIDALYSEESESTRILISLRENEVPSVRVLEENEHVATLLAFMEIATLAGYLITPPKDD